MAFQLLFFKQKQMDIKLDEVLDYFKDRPHFTTKSLSEDFHAFLYENEITEVSFKIIYSETDELVTDLTFDENFEFCYTSLALNYLKPSFFAFEIMPIVADFCKKFNLFIHDGQSLTEEKNALKQYNKDELIQSYIKNNEIAAIEFNKQFPLLYTTKEKTMYLYKYLSNYYEYEENFPVNIPILSIMKNIESLELFTMMSWENAAESLFPQCDYVLCIKEEKGFFGKKKQVLSLLSFDTILNTFKEYLEPIEKDLYIMRTSTEQVKELFNNLPINSSDEYEIIKNDEYVDVNLSNK